MEISLMKAIVENGIGIGLAVAITFMFYKILMFVLSQQKEILGMATKQNEHWQMVVSELKQEIKSSHEANAEAHKYQRDEHREMMGLLAKK